MSSVNKCVIIGRLGRDPEVKFLTSGGAVCNFSVATDEKWTDKQGQKQERTEWHNIVAWGKLAEICGEYLAKGRQVYVEGSLRTEEYEKDGVKKYATKVIARDVVFLGSNDSQQSRTAGTNTAPAREAAPVTSDDLPF